MFKQNFAVPVVVIHKGIKYTISKIVSIYCDQDEGYSIEFYDDRGMYRFWKQHFDGGIPVFADEEN